MPLSTKSLLSRRNIYVSSVLLRVALLLWSRYQDAHSPVKYTDIDYYVFTDASRFVAAGKSPFDRDTYRYTPLLAWLLLPTVKWFDFGKVLFALSDVLAGWLLEKILLEQYGLSKERAVKFAAVWLLNPMVAGISTRGSCEGLLGVLAAGLVLAVIRKKIALAGVILGFAVHFKIYPFIYATSLIWWLESGTSKSIMGFFNRDRITLSISALSTSMFFNVLSYAIYGPEYIRHSWLYHVTRLDHRHNFSVYNTLLHLHSSPSYSSASSTSFERLAFLPQILLSAVFIPLSLAKKDLAGAMLAQTFAFVAFNKVCTSQYFLWYLIFLPLYLPSSNLLKDPVLGLTALGAWVAGQAYWLWEGYRLEFLGEQRFVPGLFRAGIVFFAANCWILGVMIWDIGSKGHQRTEATLREKRS
jgi:GPI mannosyltransferase 1 subunit M